MDRSRTANCRQCFVATCLRPTIAIQICQQPVVWFAVQMDRAAKCSLAEHALHFRVRPIFAPIIEKRELSITQQFQLRQIHRFRIVRSIVDVIGTRTHFWNLPFRSTLEFPVLKNRKVNPADS